MNWLFIVQILYWECTPYLSVFHDMRRFIFQFKLFGVLEKTDIKLPGPKIILLAS